MSEAPETAGSAGQDRVTDSAALSEWIEFAVRERMLAEAREIERACEAALQGGSHGVFIARRNDGTLISAEVNPLVPYGQIYESRAVNDVS